MTDSIRCTHTGAQNYGEPSSFLDRVTAVESKGNNDDSIPFALLENHFFFLSFCGSSFSSVSAFEMRAASSFRSSSIDRDVRIRTVSIDDRVLDRLSNREYARGEPLVCFSRFYFRTRRIYTSANDTSTKQWSTRSTKALSKSLLASLFFHNSFSRTRTKGDRCAGSMIYCSAHTHTSLNISN